MAEKQRTERKNTVDNRHIQHTDSKQITRWTIGYNEGEDRTKTEQKRTK